MTGGRKLAAFIKGARREAAKLPKYRTQVGFPENVGGVALIHEFGSPRRNIPERPAFRNAMPAVERVYQAEIRRGLDRRSKSERVAGVTLNKRIVTRAAQEAASELRRQYLGFMGHPLSPQRRERLMGTAGEGKQLVGEEGKMIDSITAWVDGRDVGRADADTD